MIEDYGLIFDKVIYTGLGTVIVYMLGCLAYSYYCEGRRRRELPAQRFESTDSIELPIDSNDLETSWTNEISEEDTNLYNNRAPSVSPSPSAN